MQLKNDNSTAALHMEVQKLANRGFWLEWLLLDDLWHKPTEVEDMISEERKLLKLANYTRIQNWGKFSDAIDFSKIFTALSQDDQWKSLLLNVISNKPDRNYAYAANLMNSCNPGVIDNLYSEILRVSNVEMKKSLLEIQKGSRGPEQNRTKGALEYVMPNLHETSTSACQITALLVK